MLLYVLLVFSYKVPLYLLSYMIYMIELVMQFCVHECQVSNIGEKHDSKYLMMSIWVIKQMLTSSKSHN